MDAFERGLRNKKYLVNGFWSLALTRRVHYLLFSVKEFNTDSKNAISFIVRIILVQMNLTFSLKD